jgi:hypothetical protein
MLVGSGQVVPALYLFVVAVPGRRVLCAAVIGTNFRYRFLFAIRLTGVGLLFHASIFLYDG